MKHPIAPGARAGIFLSGVDLMAAVALQLLLWGELLNSTEDLLARWTLLPVIGVSFLVSLAACGLMLSSALTRTFALMPDELKSVAFLALIVHLVADALIFFAPGELFGLPEVAFTTAYRFYSGMTTGAMLVAAFLAGLVSLFQPSERAPV